jgi:hypothetical protein
VRAFSLGDAIAPRAGRMMGKRLCACALWSSEKAVSGTGGSVMTSALPSERNQSHHLPLSLSHHSQHCQNSAHGISTCTCSLRELRSRAVSLPYSAKEQRVLKSFSRVRKRPRYAQSRGCVFWEPTSAWFHLLSVKRCLLHNEAPLSFAIILQSSYRPVTYR